MANTTNYNWETPDDTDLVKDGAAAIRTLGSSADTTLKNLNPETTTGDIAYRSATVNVNTRLALGTAGQVLRVNSGATAPEWAAAATGGKTLLSTTSLTGASTTISSISGAYKDLYGVIYNVTTAADGHFRIAPNNVTNLSTYGGVRRITSSDAIGAQDDYFGTNGIVESTVAGYFAFLIEDYTNTSNFKPIRFQAYFQRSDGGNQSEFVGGYFKSLSAITSLVFSGAGGNFSTGTVQLYGVS